MRLNHLLESLTPAEKYRAAVNQYRAFKGLNETESLNIPYLRPYKDEYEVATSPTERSRLLAKFTNTLKNLSKLNPIDASTTGMPYYDDLMRDPEYFEKRKGVAYEIVEMSPEEYIRACIYGFSREGIHGNVRASRSDKLVKEYAEKMLNGEQFPLPFLSYRNDGFDQEGLHRAMALEYLGHPTMPVMVVKDTKDLKDDDLLEYEFPKVQNKAVSRLPDIYNYDDEDFIDDPEDDWPIDKTDIEGSRRIRKNPKTQHLGTGYFSSTYTHDDAPHDVMKIKRPSVKIKDGYDVFISALAEDDRVNTNPYFPRFRSIKRLTQNPKNNFIVRMEKLEPMQNLSEREIHFILGKIYGAKIREEILTSTLFPYTKSMHLYARLASAIEGTVSNKYFYKQVKDDDFKEAATWLKQLSKSSRTYLDLHYNNIMIRRTPYGPQVVLADPLGVSD